MNIHYTLSQLRWLVHEAGANLRRPQDWDSDVIEWQAETDTLAPHGLGITCQCGACDCDDPATTTDDGGGWVCPACADYVVDDDGECYCSRCDNVEAITESCGAGSQTHTSYRIAPPEMPTAKRDGEWALYWDTAGDDSHVVTRYATADDAAQAVAAKDWPAPTDHTNYLCGYEVRHMVDGQWVRE